MEHVLHLPLLALRLGGKALAPSIGSVPKKYPDLSTKEEEEEEEDDPAIFDAEAEAEAAAAEAEILELLEPVLDGMRILLNVYDLPEMEMAFRNDLARLLTAAAGAGIPREALLNGMIALLAGLSDDRYDLARDLTHEVVHNWYYGRPLNEDEVERLQGYHALELSDDEADRFGQIRGREDSDDDEPEGARPAQRPRPSISAPLKRTIEALALRLGGRQKAIHVA